MERMASAVDPLRNEQSMMAPPFHLCRDREQVEADISGSQLGHALVVLDFLCGSGRSPPLPNSSVWLELFLVCPYSLHIYTNQRISAHIHRPLSSSEPMSSNALYPLTMHVEAFIGGNRSA